MSIKLEDSNLFMMCKSINKNALSYIPNGYHIRNCKRDELNLWLEFPFDNEEDKKNYRSFMEQYFKDVYGSNEDLFFEKCLFICDENDTPIFLHTQAGSFRAIKLYSDLGFVLLTDEKIGYRENHLNIALPYLKEKMHLEDYNKLKFDKASKEFLDAVKTSKINQF